MLEARPRTRHQKSVPPRVDDLGTSKVATSDRNPITPRGTSSGSPLLRRTGCVQVDVIVTGGGHSGPRRQAATRTSLLSFVACWRPGYDRGRQQPCAAGGNVTDVQVSLGSYPKCLERLSSRSWGQSGSLSSGSQVKSGARGKGQLKRAEVAARALGCDCNSSRRAALRISTGLSRTWPERARTALTVLSSTNVDKILKGANRATSRRTTHEVSSWSSTSRPPRPSADDPPSLLQRADQVIE